MAAVRNEYQLHPAMTHWRHGQRGGHTLLNDAWRRQLERDPDLSEAILCVQLVFGADYELHLATKKCSTTSSFTGKKVNFQGVLANSAEVAWEYEPGEANSVAKTLSLRLPNALVDAAALVRQARVLAGVAEVSLQVDGGDYDDRLVLMRGDLTDVKYSAVTQLVSCTVADPKGSVDLHLPPYTLTSDRFTNIINASVGQVLAVVMPSFGGIQGWFVDNHPTAPEVVVCHGHLDVDTVYVDGVAYSDVSPIFPWSVLHGVDRLGAPYTAVQFNGGTGTFDGEGGEKVYVELSGGPTSGNPVQVVRRLVEQHTTLGVPGANALLFGRAEARSGYLLGRCCANASGSGNVKALEFIEGSLLESFPMLSMVWAGGGYAPVYTDRKAGLPAFRLVADQHPVLDRATSVAELPKTDCFNTFSIQYNYQPLDDEFLGYAERTPANSALCELSRRVTGERHADTIESLYITDAQVAELVMDWLVAHRTMPAHDVAYDVSPGLVVQLVLGDNVALDDAEFGWDDTVATVRRLVYRPARGELGLRVWNDAVELSGATSVGGGTTGGIGSGNGGGD